MRIAIDPIPLVLGIYAQVGGLMNRAVERTEDGDPQDLGRRFGGRRDEATDRDVKRLVKAVHTEVKTSDKLLRPDDVREILQSIRQAAEGAGEQDTTLEALDEAIEAVVGRPSDYYTFGFDPWES